MGLDDAAGRFLRSRDLRRSLVPFDSGTANVGGHLAGRIGWFHGNGAPVAIAVVVTSALFSAAHYAGAHGETFDWFSFCFRFLAGAFFALLFVYRGFGIAAGTHALYDIFVGVV